MKDASRSNTYRPWVGDFPVYLQHHAELGHAREYRASMRRTSVTPASACVVAPAG